MGIKPKIAPSTVNVSDKVQDLSIVHAINLERIKADQVNGVLDILDDLGLSIQKQLEKIDPTGVGPTYRARRLARLLEGVKATTKQHFGKAQGANSKGLGKVSTVSAKATQNIINGSLGVSLGATLPSAAVLSSLAGRTLVEGQIVKDYWKQQSAEHTGKFMRQMRIGVAGGENLQSLIQRVRGTKANNFTDGIMNSTKRKAETLVRSSVAAVNNEALINTYQANEDLFNGYQWMATLDSRTSDICKARSGLTWDKEFKPVGHAIGWTPPPAHFNCRSTVIGILKPWSDLANKPLPAVGAETLKEELEKSLLSRGLSQALISKAINKTQQSMDGYVAGNINFEDWLKSKSERFQKQILGEPKWELWKNGKIGFVDLVDQKSNPRSLAELEALVDQGKTAPLKANKAAKEAAKEQAEAAALAVKAAQKAENRAQAQLDDIIAGTAGTNKSKVYSKLKKDGIEGLSATQIIAKIDEGVTQINVSANISKAKKKLKDGKKLNKTEEAAWATVDVDLKAAYLVSLEAESAAFKKINSFIDTAEEEIKLMAQLGDTSGEDLFTLVKKRLYESTSIGNYFSETLFDLLGRDGPFLYKLKGLQGLDNLKAAKNLSNAEAEKFVENYENILAKAKALNQKFNEIKDNGNAFGSNYVVQYNALKKTSPDETNFIPQKTKVIDYYFDKGPVEAQKLVDIELNIVADTIKKQVKKLEDEVAKKAEDTKKATQYLSDAAQGGKGFSAANVAYEKLKKSGGLTGDAVVDAAKVQAEKDAVQAAKSLASVKTGIKKKFKANKKLSPKEQQVFDGLDPVDQDLLKEAASAGKTAKQLDDDAAAIVTQKATQRAEEGVLFDDLEQVGGQGGSNVGGTFKSKIDGQEYYIKAPRTDDHAKNEVLGIKLYQMLGIETPDVNFIKISGKIGDSTFDNKLGISSKIVDNLIEDGDQLASGKIKGVAEGFGADAWLANWDVVGMSYDNLKILNGRAIRVEAGGGLRYRARGELKSPWSADVPEIDSLREIEQNAKVFSGLKESQIVESVRKVVNTSDEAIRSVVESVYGIGDDVGEELITTLLARRETLRERFKKQLDKVEKKKAAQRITEQEVRTLAESRVNGLSIKADKDQIEDQSIHLTTYTDEFGDKKTRMFFKVRSDLAKNLDNQTLGDEIIETTRIGYLEDYIEKAIRSFNDKVDKAIALPNTWNIKQSSVRNAYEYALEETGKYGDEYVEIVKKRYGSIVEKIAKFNEGHIPMPSEKFDFFKKLLDIEIVRKKAVKSIFGKAKSRPVYQNSKFTDSFQELTDETFKWSGKFVTADIDGMSVRYFPEQIDELAVANRVEVDFDGQDAKSIIKAISLLEKSLDVPLGRPSQMDIEELYLRKIAYRYAGEKGDRTSYLNGISEIAAITDQKKRIDKLAEITTSLAGLKKDIRKLPTYDAEGAGQFSGHGRNHTFFPQMDGGINKEWQGVYDNHLIYHDLEFGSGDQVLAFKSIVGGGGQLISTTERLKRGLRPSGASPEEDTRTGGASYVFTRLRKKGSSNNGLYWKSDKHYRRTDALHFPSDKYGRQKFDNTDYDKEWRDEGYSETEYANYIKASSPSDAVSFAENGSNEVIFKESLSVFEDLLFFMVRPSPRYDEKEKLIAFMKDKGYKTWPDGRKLEDVIVTKDEARKLGYLDSNPTPDQNESDLVDMDLDDDIQILDE